MRTFSAAVSRQEQEGGNALPLLWGTCTVRAESRQSDQANKVRPSKQNLC